jgi:alpha-2-macroglobulin
VRVTQDLQMLPGLPPLVREGDRFDAMLTLRNTTARDDACGHAAGHGRPCGRHPPRSSAAAGKLPPLRVSIPAGGCRRRQLAGRGAGRGA